MKKHNMTMIVKEIQEKPILSASTIYAYVIKPYTGCQYGCSYCYARFMKRSCLTIPQVIILIFFVAIADARIVFHH